MAAATKPKKTPALIVQQGKQTGMSAEVVKVLDGVGTAIVNFKIKDLIPLLPKKYRDHRAVRNAIYSMRFNWSVSDSLDMRYAGDQHVISLFHNENGWVYINYSLLTTATVGVVQK